MEHKYLAIVLGKKDVGESDRLYNIYTLERGKISAMARGVRKPGSKLAGKLENFYLIDLSLMKNKGMGNISGSIVENNFIHLRGDFDILKKVFDSVKTFSRLIREEERDAEVFRLLVDYLEAMDILARIGEAENKPKKADLISQGFVFKLLDFSGYKIEIRKCIKSGKNFSRGNNFFDYSRGGIVRGDCVSDMGSIVPISDNSIKVIRIFFQNNLASLTKLDVGDRDIKEIERVLRTFIFWVC
ncbi:MAG: DNA repair protein RecO [Candidatus Moranbacteria bacterium]|jgi:DNA repair protein RecO (recombination protein O)|nr:DNA repair protein RecO [Candidatus Moranbacteria bacterium]MDD5652118.1 DNA repair protein RecO [Candidatus Moranbacteria bacterium]MDX9855191.1 DNA repair protein RecO [Candidatus Moranbacteria bacterium]